MTQEIVNAFTVDVEDYYMVSAFSKKIEYRTWDRYESRVEDNTYRLLDLLEEYGIRGTFFVLGWIADRVPSLVREIQKRGHELGCHSYSHRLVFDLSPEEFRNDTRTAKAAIENCSGAEVIGYRAPSCSITPKSLWALEILGEEGFRYDSSIFPIIHDRYGYPGFHRFPVATGSERNNGVFEIPLSTVRVLGKNLPIAGGGYLRLYPYELTKWGIRRINILEGEAAIIYVHPWEIDTGQPRISAGWLATFRHYLNIEKNLGKIRSLLRDFRFGTLRSICHPRTDSPSILNNSSGTRNKV